MLPTRVSPRAFDREVAESLKPTPPHVDELVNLGVLLADTIDAHRVLEHRQPTVGHWSTYPPPISRSQEACMSLLGAMEAANQLSELIPLRDGFEPAFLKGAAQRAHGAYFLKSAHLTQSPPFDERLQKNFTAVEQRLTEADKKYEKLEFAACQYGEAITRVEGDANVRAALRAFCILQSAKAHFRPSPNSIEKSDVMEAVADVARTALWSEARPGSVDARAEIEQSLLHLREVASEALRDCPRYEVPLRRSAESFGDSEPFWSRPEISLNDYKNLVTAKGVRAVTTADEKFRTIHADIQAAFTNPTDPVG